MFTLAIDAGKLLMRPKIHLLQEQNARQGFFERDQLVGVLARLSPAATGRCDVRYWTGWRRSEILALEWSRVDRKAGIVRLDVGTTKNKDGREFHCGAIVELRDNDGSSVGGT